MKRSLNYDQRSKRQEKFRKQKNENYNIKNRLVSIKSLISDGKLSDALNEVEELLEKYPENDFGLFQHANILYLLGEFTLAKEEFQNIVDQNLDSKYGALYKLGNIAILENNHELAKELFTRTIEESPYEEVLSVIALSKLELEEENYEEAYAVLERYANIDNDNIVIQRAWILKREGKSEEAYNLLKKHNFDNNNRSLLKNYYCVKACLESELGLFDEAEVSFRYVLNGPKTKSYYRMLIEYSIFNCKIGNYRRAIDSLLEVINGKYGEYYSHKAKVILGNIYRECGELELAKKIYLESANDSNKEDITEYISLCDLFMIEKDYEEAKKYADKYIAKANSNKQKASGNLRLAFIAMKENRIDECERLVNKINPIDLEKTDNKDYKCLKVYLKFLSGNEEKTCDSYLFSQFRNYSLEGLKEHIDKVHTITKQYISTFSKDIDFDELILELPDLLEKARLVKNNYFEKYEIEYENIGFVNGKKSNTLRIIVFPETKKVITMYPIRDNNYQKNVINKYQKSKSQIDKFNNKYKKGSN